MEERDEGSEIDQLAESNQPHRQLGYPTPARSRHGIISSTAVIEMNGDQYQSYKKPLAVNWQINELWNKHTTSSEAKYWGTTKPHRSKPINVLYSRHRNFDSVPAFKQYPENEINDIVQRIRRPTSSSNLRNSNDQTETQPKPAKSTDEALLTRLMRPTTSYQRRKELTLKYKPGNKNNDGEEDENSEQAGNPNRTGAAESGDKEKKSAKEELSKKEAGSSGEKVADENEAADQTESEREKTSPKTKKHVQIHDMNPDEPS